MGIFESGLSFSGFSFPILADIFIYIDAIIYKVADWGLRAFFEIANLGAISTENEIISAILNRVMVLAGVFALFRLAIMLINTIVNPDKTKDAGQTGVAFVKNAVLAVVLLIASPLIFSVLGDFQNRVIENKVIPKIVYGPEKVNEGYAHDMENETTSKQFVNSVWLLFFQDNKGVGGSATCESSSSAACTMYKRVAAGTAGITALSSYHSDFDYTPVISGIIGMVLVYYFVIFAIELGTRLVKLVILQVISPIPIIMSVDPSQKDKLKNFGNTYFGIYIQVFVRIITFYLAFVVLVLLRGGLSVDNGSSANIVFSITDGLGTLATVLVYIGVFQAAKEIPKLIEDAIGVKLGAAAGGKGFGGVLKGIVGGTIGGAAGVALGGVAGAASGGFGGMIAGGFTGLRRGAITGMTADAAHPIKTALGGVAVVKGAHTVGGNVRGAGGLGAYTRGGVENFFGADRRDKATIEKFDKEIKDKDSAIEKFNDSIGDRKKADELRSRLQSVVTDKFDSNHGSLEERLSNDTRLGYFKSKLSAAEAAGGLSLEEYRKLSTAVSTREKEIRSTYDLEKNKYFSQQIYGATSPNNNPAGPSAGTRINVDSDIEQALKDYNSYVESQGLENRKITSLGDVERTTKLNEKEILDFNVEIEKAEDAKREMEKKKKEFERSDEYKRRHDRKKDPEGRPYNRWF